METRLRRGLAAAVATGALLAPAAGAHAATHAATPAAGPAAQGVEGGFVASVDFQSLQARDVRGNKCEFTVNGTLSFSGPVDGDAIGTTTAVIFAPCESALAAPPGTFFDVFRFEGAFTGEVLGEPATGALSYAGVTRVGGGIEATVILDGEDARAVLRADAQVAVGGTYSGVAKAG
ncbi:hypothetical protein GA707_08800 [Nostocoides sp. F2B08]|uniref:hypothetical protein n=1 Tax=Nostocoides sp. F2B08 TaxID=2653936 RepID=UPI001262FC92|nr:hypothetical protein [Tetrasphaera sp. F2B08]KAB7744680.1 hypothetical protein GA707_08800 [Tetrasphaera sp. F2B08]